MDVSEASSPGEVETSDHENRIGQAIAQDKNFANYRRKRVWVGSEADFKDQGKATPAAEIQRSLPIGEFAFRAIGGKELEAIVSGDGVGGVGIHSI